ncbi:unnamed protein product [Fusarium fujikuroi]|uniref:Uncharacterized protein n=1 Tax=Fusarium fujikuroi TaxID=5127 RepID=A0A9Q9RG56_FUSFU|nr:unnamed protein product [Fusarium fujikuroi]
MPPSISVKRRPIHLSHHPQGLKLAQKPWRPQDAPHGTQVVILLPPRTQLRTIKEMYRQGARNAIGAAENALLLAELVKSLITPGVTADQHEKARSILTSMGDLKGLTASLNIIVADHTTESEPPQLGSAIRAAYNSGGSATTGSRFNDTPIPIDLTGSLSALKRRATQLVDLESDEDLAQFEEPANRTRDGIPTTPRPLPVMGGTKGLTTGLDMIIGEQSPELAPSSIDSVLRAAHAGRSGSASSTFKKFNDKPIPIDLTGSSSSRKRQAPDHDSDEDLLGALNAPTTTPTQALPVLQREWPAAPYIIKGSIAFGNGHRVVYLLLSADEGMVFLSDDAAQMFGHLLLILRNRVSESLPVSEAARMAGISKSLIISIDLPLFIPYPDSTAMAFYLTSISNMSIFNNMDDRALTLPEGFLSVHVIEDKLIHLGQSWKPLTTTNRHKWAQVISAEEARTLRWEDYDAINQAPQVSEG